MAGWDPSKRKVTNRRYYEANKERERARARERMRRKRNNIRAWILTYLKTHPCVDCGETNPVVLEFDHVQDEKHFHIGQATAMNVGLDRLQVEVAKCEVRCANCHRKKTYREAGYTHKDT